MTGVWKTARVFISSTFRDMHAERDHLVKVVFPALRERLEKHRVNLIDIDLRWGVTREQAENNQVLDLCLKQIDECRPFFIGILGERYGWVPTRYPADALKNFGWIQHHTGKSVTELEILHGVLHDSKMRGRAFFYFRDPVAVHGVPEAIRQNVFADTDPEFNRKLEDLKWQIRYSGYPVMENYPARWDPDAYDRPSRAKGRLVGLEAFGERVRDQLWQAIQEELKLPEQPSVGVPALAVSPFAEEQEYHERFMESRLRVYVGRKNVHNDLARYADGDEKYTCLLVGASGSGKSATLARFVRVYKRARRNTLMISHFIGASPRSTNLRDMLRKFCQLLKDRFGFAEEVPEETAKLSVTFREFVGKVPTDTRVLLVIDALNQLDETDRAQELYWLPVELPPQVKVIVSCITDSGKTEPVLEAFRWRKHYPVQLAALSDVEQRLIIRQVPSLSAKTLDDEQVRLLLSNPAATNPLFLLVALEELRGFASYEQLNERITAFPREGDTVTAIFTQVIQRLDEEFKKKLVETVLTLLASARRGLSERELQELVAGPDGADDLFPVLRQLRPYLLSRAGLIDFYHRNLLKAVCERYLASAQQERLAHACLADYFHRQDYWLESLEEQRRRPTTVPPTPRPANVRKVDELPWQLLQAADWQRSEQLLTDLTFLEAKAEAGMVFDLAADFSAAIGAMSADRPLLRILRLLEEALRRDIHFIARHALDYPQGLFQCMWNSCWWYDSPEAAGYYVDGKSPGQEAGINMHRLLESWRAAKKLESPSLTFLRSLRPPAIHVGGAQRAVFRGHASEVTSVAFSADGRRVLSSSGDKTVRMWDCDTGQQIRCLTGHKDSVTSVAFSTDGRHVLSGSSDKTVRVWECDSGHQLLCLTHEGSVESVAFSTDSRRVVSGSSDKTVRVWECDTGRQLLCLTGHQDCVFSVAFSRDARHILSGSGDRTVRVWDSESGQQIHCFTGHTDLVTSVTFSPDGRLVASSSGTRILVWENDAGQQIHCLTGHEDLVTCVAFSADGRRIVSCSGDQTVRTWNKDDGQQLDCFTGHEDLVSSAAFSSDGRRLVSGSLDKTVRVWDSGGGPQLLNLTGHEASVTSMAISPDGNRIVSSGDRTVRVWDSDSGQQVLCLSGHEGLVNSVTFSPDGKRILSGSGDKTVRVWDTDSGQQLLCIAGHKSGGEWVFEALGLMSAQQLLCLAGHKSHVSSVSFSPDGKRILSGSWDKTVRIWDSESGQQILCLTGHEGWVKSVAFSPDGARVVSGSYDKTVRVWDSASGQQLLCLTGNRDAVLRVAFTLDGRLILSRSVNNTVLVWDSLSGEIGPAEPDVAAEAGGEAPSHCRAVHHDLETAIECAAIGRPVAWFPIVLSEMVSHPSCRTWAGSIGNYVCLFTFEGNAPSAS